MDQIFGQIERIVFHNQENGFTVARLKQPRRQELTTIVGNLPGVQEGENIRCIGTWKNNPSYGLQLDIQEYHIEAPNDVDGIKKYLESGMVKGIGPIYAERIVKKFGADTLEIIDKDPEKLLRVAGIGKKRLDTIKTLWNEQKSVREVMIFLQKYGVSSTYAHKIFKNYGKETIERVKENPYLLAQNIVGIGFKKADTIAKKMGYPNEATTRIDSGIEYVLSELSAAGHVCYPLESFLNVAQQTLQVDETLIQERIDHLIKEEILYIENDHLFSKNLYLCEKGIADEVYRLANHPCRLRSVDVDKAVKWAQEQLRIELAENQKEAIRKSIEEKLHIITGGPGTGKSTITKAILRITQMLTSRIILAAPTGRAAKRMAEITGRDASTIHSLLQYDFKRGSFQRNRENPIDGDLFIIDEASMIDTQLMYHLLKAIPSSARVVFVGDIHQLPSVGPGNVLKDMIESDSITVTMLKEIFRQAAGSKIITNAHKILNGEFPDIENDYNSDFFFIHTPEPEEALDQILQLIGERLPKQYGFNPFEDIQVLAPMKRGVIGIENLNHVLQKNLNPQKNYLSYGGSRFALGDKVMQIRNNYNKEVFNGDIGRIKTIDREEHELIISFDGKEVVYAFRDLDEIVLAYATSIHKYQGSECPCVIIPVHTTHFIMLHRNLLYTGVTRGKKVCVLVGTPKALHIAISNDDVKNRYTGLKQRLERNT